RAPRSARGRRRGPDPVAAGPRPPRVHRDGGGGRPRGAGRDAGAAGPGRGGAPAADRPGRRHAGRGRARRGAGGRSSPPRHRRPVRREHAGGHGGLPRHDLLHARGARDPAHALAGRAREHDRRRRGAGPGPALRGHHGRGVHGQAGGWNGHRRRWTGAGRPRPSPRLRAGRGGGGRVRLLLDGARVVSDARAHPGGVGLHVRAGAGRARVGRHVGRAYSWTTAGGIAGALGGGFGLLPLLGAPGSWRACALLLVALALAALLVARSRPGGAWVALALAGAAAVAASLALPGPTAAWRHGGVAVGRILTLGPGPLSGPSGYRAWIHDARRFVLWDRDGVESSVAVEAMGGLAFVVNGKIDGNARDDAPTQVMGGLLGCLLRADVHRSMVIGLGTGSTAGWLAAVPGMEATDVVELEPAILTVARMCAPVNHG